MYSCFVMGRMDACLSLKVTRSFVSLYIFNVVFVPLRAYLWLFMTQRWLALCNWFPTATPCSMSSHFQRSIKAMIAVLTSEEWFDTTPPWFLLFCPWGKSTGSIKMSSIDCWIRGHVTGGGGWGGGLQFNSEREASVIARSVHHSNQ